MHQGFNARKVISKVYASFVLQCNANTRRMSKPEMGSIFHIKSQWNILVIGNYYVNYQNYQSSMLLTSSDTRRTLRHLFLFTNSAQRELQYVRRVYASAINFPCITFLGTTMWPRSFVFTSMKTSNISGLHIWNVKHLWKI